jgi:hypothetical protein
LALALCNAAGLALYCAGDLGGSRPWYERALAISERVLGPDHPSTAGGLNSMAGLLRDQGELAAARPLLERALAIVERKLGPDHPSTATGLNNLARTRASWPPPGPSTSAPWRSASGRWDPTTPPRPRSDAP